MAELQPLPRRPEGELQPWMRELQTMPRGAASGVHRSPDWYGELQSWIAGSWNRHPKELQPASRRAANDERRPASGYDGGAAMERAVEVLRPATSARRSCGRRHRSCDRRHGELQLRDTLLHARNRVRNKGDDGGEGRRPAARAATGETRRAVLPGRMRRSSMTA